MNSTNCWAPIRSNLMETIDKIKIESQSIVWCMGVCYLVSVPCMASVIELLELAIQFSYTDSEWWEVTQYMIETFGKKNQYIPETIWIEYEMAEIRRSYHFLFPHFHIFESSLDRTLRSLLNLSLHLLGILVALILYSNLMRTFALICCNKFPFYSFIKFGFHLFHRNNVQNGIRVGFKTLQTIYEIGIVLCT